MSLFPTLLRLHLRVKDFDDFARLNGEQRLVELWYHLDMSFPFVILRWVHCFVPSFEKIRMAKQRCYPMLGFKTFGNAEVTLSGIELANSSKLFRAPEGRRILAGGGAQAQPPGQTKRYFSRPGRDAGPEFATETTLVALTVAGDLFRIKVVLKEFVPRVFFDDADPVGAEDDVEALGTKVDGSRQMRDLAADEADPLDQ